MALNLNKHPTFGGGGGSCMKNYYLNHSTISKPKLRLWMLPSHNPRSESLMFAWPYNRKLMYYRIVSQTVFVVFNVNWKLKDIKHISWYILKFINFFKLINWFDRELKIWPTIMLLFFLLNYTHFKSKTFMCFKLEL